MLSMSDSYLPIAPQVLEPSLMLNEMLDMPEIVSWKNQYAQYPDRYALFADGWYAK
jgi:hypothetical protein